MERKDNFKHLVHINKKSWNRKILNYCWTMVLLSSLASVIVYFFSYKGNLDFINTYLYIPTTILVTLLIITELIVYVFDNIVDYVIIMTISLMISVLVYIHSTIHGLQAIYIIGIIISVFYFNFKKIIFSCVLNLGSFICIYLINPYIRNYTTLSEFMAFIVFLFLGFLIAKGIMEREQELLIHLSKTMQSKEELLIKTIIMEQSSKLDSLTGLYNNKSFNDYLNSLVSQAQKYKFNIHLAILDIDNFKRINDTYGHKAGDIVLKRTSKIIKENITYNDFLCRYGGEEFSIIFTDIDFEKAYNNLERIRNTIASTPHPELEGENITLSIGLVKFSPDMDGSEFFRKSDELLYKAKRSGKNKIAI